MSLAQLGHGEPTLLAWGWIGLFAWSQFGPSCPAAVLGTGNIPCLGCCNLEKRGSAPSTVLPFTVRGAAVLLLSPSFFPGCSLESWS